MSERDEKRGGSGVAIGGGLVLLFLPVLYILSVGPAEAHKKYGTWARAT